jgi:hypothetical protein
MKYPKFRIGIGRAGRWRHAKDDLHYGQRKAQPGSSTVLPLDVLNIHETQVLFDSPIERRLSWELWSL